MTQTPSPKPVFIFSLPRAGSTWLQRLLAGHPDVATAAEPWLLLPLVYALKPFGSVSEYGQKLAAGALDDFTARLPGREADYYAEVAETARRLYAKAAHDGATHFVDKTPRYHLIAREIADMFPEARFIFLWRNPLAVAASILDTWGKGRWNLFLYGVDFEKGIPNLIDLADERRENFLELRYEDLLTDTEPALRRVCEFADLDFRPEMLAAAGGTALTGRMGDKKYLTRQYDAGQQLEGWPLAFATPLRRRWARAFLHRLGDATLSRMGYDLAELETALMEPKSSAGFPLSDLLIPLQELGYQRLHLTVLKRQLLEPGFRQARIAGLH